MRTSPSISIALALFSGMFVGSTLVPMKFVRRWAWENTWLVFAVCSYMLCPWIVAVFSVPRLGNVYAQAGFHVCATVGLLGMGWGIAVVLFGLAVDWAGLSISTALLYGASVALGSLGALCILNRASLFTRTGAQIALCDALVLIGVGFCAFAGKLREGQRTAELSRNRLGIIVALMAGVLSTLFNLVLVYGDPIRLAAISGGADPKYASNAIWSIGVSMGSLPSVLWCIHLLRRNCSWQQYGGEGAGFNLALCISMAALWITGTVCYGMAAASMGRLGTVIGWPIYLAAVVLSGMAWGWVLGEWRNAPAHSLKLLTTGVAAQIIGIILLARIS